MSVEEDEEGKAVGRVQQWKNFFAERGVGPEDIPKALVVHEVPPNLSPCPRVDTNRLHYWRVCSRSALGLALCAPSAPMRAPSSKSLSVCGSGRRLSV